MDGNDSSLQMKIEKIRFSEIITYNDSYANGSTNYHYWSSFESKMTPIGSGKTLAEIKRHY